MGMNNDEAAGFAFGAVIGALLMGIVFSVVMAFATANDSDYSERRLCRQAGGHTLTLDSDHWVCIKNEKVIYRG